MMIRDNPTKTVFILMNPKTIKKCKLSRQEFYAGGLTSMISLKNLPIFKTVNFSDNFP